MECRAIGAGARGQRFDYADLVKIYRRPTVGGGQGPNPCQTPTCESLTERGRPLPPRYRPYVDFSRTAQKMLFVGAAYAANGTLVPSGVPPSDFILPGGVG